MKIKYNKYTFKNYKIIKIYNFIIQMYLIL